MDANAADPSPARVTVEAALDAFIGKKKGQRLSHSWLYKFSLMQRELVNFARGRGLTYIDEFSDDELGLLSRSWKVAPITAQKRQERWHSFFSYCVRKRWLKLEPICPMTVPAIAAITRSTVVALAIPNMKAMALFSPLFVVGTDAPQQASAGFVRQYIAAAAG